MDDIFSGTLHWITRLLEVTGIAAIVLGIVIAGIKAMLRHTRQLTPEQQFREFRSNIGRAVLLGLEFLVAADIINTVAIEPTLQSLAVLAGIVAIRTFLSFALEVEISGHLPWRRAQH